jgi:hypothetical protein
MRISESVFLFTGAVSGYQGSIDAKMAKSLVRLSWYSKSPNDTEKGRFSFLFPFFLRYPSPVLTNTLVTVQFTVQWHKKSMVDWRRDELFITTQILWFLTLFNDDRFH